MSIAQCDGTCRATTGRFCGYCWGRVKQRKFGNTPPKFKAANNRGWQKKNDPHEKRDKDEENCDANPPALKGKPKSIPAK